MGGESPANRCACLARGLSGNVGTADSQVLKKISLSVRMGGPGTSQQQFTQGEVGDFRLCAVPAAGGRYRAASSQGQPCCPRVLPWLADGTVF